jgi:hypothetical protein
MASSAIIAHAESSPTYLSTGRSATCKNCSSEASCLRFLLLWEIHHYHYESPLRKLLLLCLLYITEFPRWVVIQQFGSSFVRLPKLRLHMLRSPYKHPGRRVSTKKSAQTGVPSLSQLIAEERHDLLLLPLTVDELHHHEACYARNRM